MLQQRIQNNHIELPDISRKTGRVSDDPGENARVRQLFPAVGARDEFRVDIDAGDLQPRTAQ